MVEDSDDQCLVEWNSPSGSTRRCIPIHEPCFSPDDRKKSDNSGYCLPAVWTTEYKDNPDKSILCADNSGSPVCAVKCDGIKCGEPSDAANHDWCEGGPCDYSGSFPVCGYFFGCSPACKTCSGPNEDDCASCAEAGFVPPDCKDCDSSHCLVNGKCIANSEGCQGCSTTGTTPCLTCTGGVCTACAEAGFVPPDCKDCDSSHCLVNGKCIANSEGCQGCSTTGTAPCLTCTGGVCTACAEAGFVPPDCKDCDSSHCLVNGKCIANSEGCQGCSTTGTTPCLTCTGGVCTACAEAGFVPPDCTACSGGYCLDVETATCIQAGNACSTGYCNGSTCKSCYTTEQPDLGKNCIYCTAIKQGDNWIPNDCTGGCQSKSCGKAPAAKNNGFCLDGRDSDDQCLVEWNSPSGSTRRCIPIHEPCFSPDDRKKPDYSGYCLPAVWTKEYKDNPDISILCANNSRSPVCAVKCDGIKCGKPSDAAAHDWCAEQSCDSSGEFPVCGTPS